MMRVAQRLQLLVMIQDPSVSSPLLMGNFCFLLVWKLVSCLIIFIWIGSFYAAFKRFRLHIIDLDPSSVTTGGWLEDTSLVEKYNISEEDYAKRTGKFYVFVFLSNEYGEALEISSNNDMLLCMKFQTVLGNSKKKECLRCRLLLRLRYDNTVIGSCQSCGIRLIHSKMQRLLWFSFQLNHFQQTKENFMEDLCANIKVCLSVSFVYKDFSLPFILEILL